MKSDFDLELQELFVGCTVSFIRKFCKQYDFNYNVYEDETGVRFFIHIGQANDDSPRCYFSPDGGFTMCVSYVMYRKKIIKNFKQFKNLKVFI